MTLELPAQIAGQLKPWNATLTHLWKLTRKWRQYCRRAISYLQGYSSQSFSCKNLGNQKPTANTVRSTRRTTLHWMRGKIKKLSFIKHFLYLSFSFRNSCLNKAKYSMIYEKLSRVFSVAGFRSLRRNKANNSITSNRPFFSRNETPCIW